MSGDFWGRCDFPRKRSFLRVLLPTFLTGAVLTHESAIDAPPSVQTGEMVDTRSGTWFTD